MFPEKLKTGKKSHTWRKFIPTETVQLNFYFAEETVGKINNQSWTIFTEKNPHDFNNEESFCGIKELREAIFALTETVEESSKADDLPLNVL